MVDTVVSETVGSTRRSLALAVLCAGWLMVILDTTIVSVALPAVQSDLRLQPSELTWVVNAYLLPFGLLLLPAGRLGDLAGRRRVFLAGLAVFTAASAACGLAPAAGALIAARAAQGAGGALASAVVLGMIVDLYREPGERGRAIGVYAFVGAAGASIGTAAGGVLTQALGWHAIFLVNVPIGVAAVVLALRVLPGDPARPAGAAAPIVPVGLLRSRAVWAANLVQVAMVAGYYGQQFLLALDLRHVVGLGSADVGLAMLPVPIAIAVVSLTVSAPLADRIGPRRTLLAGLVVGTLALVALAATPPGGPYVRDLLPAFIALGIGAGLAMPALAAIAMSAAAPEDAGVASGLLSTTQQIGAAAGTALLVGVAAARTRALAPHGGAGALALASGYRVGFAVAAAAVLAAAGLTIALVPRRAVR